MKNENKLKNLIVGQMLGDSFCLPYEFLHKKLAKKRFNKYKNKQSLFFGYGLTSDDSDHMLLTAQALVKNSSPEKFQKDLAKKIKYWFLTLPTGIGLTTLKSIFKLWLGFSPERSGIRSSGNGPLMRVPIIAAYHSDNKEKYHSFIKKSTTITHTNEDAVAAAQGFGNLIAYIKNNNSLPSLQGLNDLLLDVENKNEIWLKYVEILMLHINEDMIDFIKKINCEKGVSGYIMHTSIFSIYVLYQNKSFEESLALIIKAGGDTDTIGAITGAALGLLNKNEEVEQSLLKIFPPIQYGDFNRMVNKNFWINLLIKNIVGTPIILTHGIIRLLMYPTTLFVK